MTLRLGVLLGCMAVYSSAQAVTPPDVALYESVLQAHVRADGRVDYAGLKQNLAPLDRFVAQLGSVSPQSHPALFPDRPHRLAYWINAYNALVLWQFAKEYPEKRLRLTGLLGKAQFFYRLKFRVGGRFRTLADIENATLRKELAEPRIHFAIVCASASCPPLSRQAYRPETLSEQLDRAATAYLQDSRHVRLDPVRREATLAKIFDWFGEDFGKTPVERLRWIAQYRPADRAVLNEGNWKVRYFDYDWSPNDIPRSAAAAPASCACSSSIGRTTERTSTAVHPKACSPRRRCARA
jgi:hypothetical protein